MAVPDQVRHDKNWASKDLQRNKFLCLKPSPINSQRRSRRILYKVYFLQMLVLQWIVFFFWDTPSNVII